MSKPDTALKEGAALLVQPRAGRVRLPSPLPPVHLPPPGPKPGWTPEPAKEYARPQYAGRFQCIASACEDTCCKGWEVPIDRKTYEKYERSEVLKPHLGTLIVLNTKSPTPSDYARIPLTAQAECGFLDEERMCGIQKQLGAEMLSVTCATYPRAISTNAREVETALNLSCPEAARVTLLETNLLGEGFWREHGPDRYTSLREAGRKADPSPSARAKRVQPSRLPRGFEPQLAIREYALLVLGDRRYPLWQRLYLLGILTRRLQALSGASPTTVSVAAWAETNPEKVAQLLADSARVAMQESLRLAMNQVLGQPDQQLQLVVELLRIRVRQPPVPMRFIECVQDFEEGLGCGTVPSEQIPHAYAESYRRYYRPLMEQHPHLLENYLINFVFKNNFPFGRPKAPGVEPSAEATNAESEQLALCMHAAVTQTLLVGMAARYREGFDCTHVVKLVQSMAKTFEHSLEAIQQIAEFVKARKLNNLKGMTLLLRQD